MIQAGQWHHVGGEYQTLTQPPGCHGPRIGGIDIWIDGVRWNMTGHLPTGCVSRYNVTPEAGSSPLNIATNELDSFFAGGVGKVAIYDSLLPPIRIAAHFQAMTGKAPGGSCGVQPILCPRGDHPTGGYRRGPTHRLNRGEDGTDFAVIEPIDAFLVDERARAIDGQPERERPLSGQRLGQRLGVGDNVFVGGPDAQVDPLAALKEHQAPRQIRVDVGGVADTAHRLGGHLDLIRI